MSLYVKVFCGFFNHRKTIKLRSMIGDDALWVPPALWAYAAQNQPDGDFSGYSDTEIAMAISYGKDASSMIQALRAAVFLDESGRIHGWEEHNGYHETYSKRAKAAAEARWNKPPPAPPKEEKDTELIRREALLEDCNKNACSIIEFLNVETGRKYRPEGKTLKQFASCAEDVDFDFEGIKKMVQRQIKKWKGTEQEEYLRPSTLFRKSKFNEYYAAKDAPIITTCRVAEKRPDRSIGTANEGIAHEYEGMGNMAQMRS